MKLPLPAELRSLRAATKRTQEEVGQMAKCSRGVISLVERDILELVSAPVQARIRIACATMRAELQEMVHKDTPEPGQVV